MTHPDFALLRNMAVFGGLNDHSLDLILSHSDTAEVAADDYFFHEGDQAKSLFVLRHGFVAVERLWNGTTIVLGRLGSGDCIGEMALIDMMPRSASVRAEQPCVAIEITTASLYKLYKQDLEQYAIIMMNMGREVSRRLRVADDRLFTLEKKLPELSL